MSTIIQGYQLRTLLLGTQLIKASLTFPQTATENLFTVSGGSVLVTSFFGLVTVATTTDPAMTLGLAPTTGTAEAAGLATTTALTSAEAGTWLGLLASSGKAGALVNGAHAGATVFSTTPFVVPPGNITWTTGASEGGAVTWYLSYVELDSGASVS